MGFLEDLSDKITRGGATVAKKAKEVSEVATLTATVEKEKINLDKLYMQAGKQMYEEKREILASNFPASVAKIDETIKKIDDAKEAIKVAKGVSVCPGCGKEVERNVRFCPYCGASMIVRE